MNADNRPDAGAPAEEIVSSRTFDMPRDAVYRAFADPAILARWWGPHGFTNTFHAFDLRPGGAWRFTMSGPDGAAFEMVHAFVEIVPLGRIVFDHAQAGHNFRMTMTFADEPGTGAVMTRVTWRMQFESAAEAERLRAIIAEKNEENFDRLGVMLSGNHTDSC